MNPSDFSALILPPASSCQAGENSSRLDEENLLDQIKSSFRQAGVEADVVETSRPAPAPEKTGIFLTTWQYPVFRPWTLEILMREYYSARYQIHAPSFYGKQGMPLLAPPSMIAALSTGPGAPLLKNGRIRTIDVPDRNILFAVNGPGDLPEYRKRLQGLDIPSPDECELILDALGKTPEDIKRHCRAAARAACVLGRALVKAGMELNLEMIRASALLHDLAKGRKNHAETGGRMLMEKGFPRVARIVAGHTNFESGMMETVTEAEVVYLADKLVDGECLVPLEKRYLSALKRFGADPAAREKINMRWQRAEQSRQRMTEILGRPLEDIVRETAE